VCGENLAQMGENTPLAMKKGMEIEKKLPVSLMIFFGQTPMIAKFSVSLSLSLLGVFSYSLSLTRALFLSVSQRDTLSEAVVSSRTLVTFVTWLISGTEFSSSELVLSRHFS